MPTPKKIKMPKTDTPGSVIFILSILTGGILLLGIGLMFIKFWFIIITLIILALATPAYLADVDGFHALIVLNYFTGEQRTIFQGLWPKLPWEKQQQVIDLRTELGEEMNATFPTLDAIMSVRYVYKIRPDFTSSNPGESIILFASYEPSVIEHAGRSKFSSLMSDYYRTRASDDLKSKEDIYQGTFELNPGLHEIGEFEEEHGCKVKITIEDSDLPKDAQKYKDMISGAKSLQEAIQSLVDGGMDRKDAEKTVKLMNLENVNENLYSITVDGLQSLTNFNVVGNPFGGNPKKEGGKP